MHIFGQSKKVNDEGTAKQLLETVNQLRSERNSMGILICQLIRDRGGSFTYEKSMLLDNRSWRFDVGQSEDGKQVTITIVDKAPEPVAAG